MRTCVVLRVRPDRRARPTARNLCKAMPCGHACQCTHACWCVAGVCARGAWAIRCVRAARGASARPQTSQPQPQRESSRVRAAASRSPGRSGTFPGRNVLASSGLLGLKSASTSRATVVRAHLRQTGRELRRLGHGQRRAIACASIQGRSPPRAAPGVRDLSCEVPCSLLPFPTPKLPRGFH